MSANAARRLSRFGSSFIHRAPAVLAFFLAIAAVAFATQEELIGAYQRFQDAKLDYVQGRLEKAEAGYRAVIEIRARLSGPEHPETLTCRQHLADLLNDRGRIAEAVAEYRAVRVGREHTLGPEHPDTQTCRLSLERLLIAQGKYVEAEAEIRSTLGVCQRALGAEHSLTLDARRSLASALSRQGKYAEAEAELRGVLAVSLRVYGKSDPIAWSVHEQLAAVLEKQSRYADAEKEWRTALLGYGHSDGPRDFFVNGACFRLAKNLAYQDKKEEALALARQAHEGFRKSQGEAGRLTKQAKTLVDVIENPLGAILGRFSDAAGEWFGGVGIPYLKIVIILLPIAVMWYALNRIFSKR